MKYFFLLSRLTHITKSLNTWCSSNIPESFFWMTIIKIIFIEYIITIELIECWRCQVANDICLSDTGRYQNDRRSRWNPILQSQFSGLVWMIRQFFRYRERIYDFFWRLRFQSSSVRIDVFVKSVKIDFLTLVYKDSISISKIWKILSRKKNLRWYAKKKLFEQIPFLENIIIEDYLAIISMSTRTFFERMTRYIIDRHVSYHWNASVLLWHVKLSSTQIFFLTINDTVCTDCHEKIEIWEIKRQIWESSIIDSENLTRSYISIFPVSSIWKKRIDLLDLLRS